MQLLGIEFVSTQVLTQIQNQMGNLPVDLLNFCNIVDQVKSAELKELKQSIQNTVGAQEGSRMEWVKVKEFFKSTEPIPTLKKEGPPSLMGRARQVALFLITNRWTAEYNAWSDVVESVIKLEQGVTIWRQRHARMVEMMIGRRIGTGGSSGVAYLDSTASYRVFQDLWYIRSLCISKSEMDRLCNLNLDG